MSIPSIAHHFIRPQGYSQAHHSHSVPYFGAQDPLQRSAFQDCWEAQPGLLNMDPTKTGQSLRSIVYNNSISCNHVCITYDSYDVCIYIRIMQLYCCLMNISKPGGANQVNQRLSESQWGSFSRKKHTHRTRSQAQHDQNQHLFNRWCSGLFDKFDGICDVWTLDFLFLKDQVPLKYRFQCPIFWGKVKLSD